MECIKRREIIAKGFEEGTKNYYFIKADKEKWAKIKAVVDFTYEIVTDGETHKNEGRK